MYTSTGAAVTSSAAAPVTATIYGTSTLSTTSNGLYRLTAGTTWVYVTGGLTTCTGSSCAASFASLSSYTIQPYTAAA